MMLIKCPTSVILGVLFCAVAIPAAYQPAKPKPGVSDTRIRFPISALHPLAVFPVPGKPDWLALTDEGVWVANEPKNSVTRLDGRTNTPGATVVVGERPCSGLVVAFGSLWVPLCGSRAVARIDVATGKPIARINSDIADSEGGIAASSEGVWFLTDSNGTLARIDPATNQIVQRTSVSPGSFAVTFGAGALWVTSTAHDSLARVDPRTGSVTATIPVGKAPRFLAVGEGAVWTLNQGDGSVSRVDPETNSLRATIEVGVPGPGGEIAAGEGSVWVTSFGFPISRIDPTSNAVVQQFVGEGGDSIRAGHGSVWLTNLRQENVWRLDPRAIAKVVGR